MRAPGLGLAPLSCMCLLGSEEAVRRLGPLKEAGASEKGDGLVGARGSQVTSSHGAPKPALRRDPGKWQGLPEPHLRSSAWVPRLSPT